MQEALKVDRKLVHRMRPEKRKNVLVSPVILIEENHFELVFILFIFSVVNYISSCALDFVLRFLMQKLVVVVTVLGCSRSPTRSKMF